MKLTIFICMVIFMAEGMAAILPTGITTSTLPNSQDTTNPYTDDIILESITFGSTTYSASSGQFAAVNYAKVTDGRENINAEWGDNDTADDGNPDPFTRIGLDPFLSPGVVNTAIQESTDPAIQDAAIASAYHTLSLNEGIDGENDGFTYTFHMIFAKGIVSDGNTLTPEIMFFERGGNDNIAVRAIIGGTFDAPEYAETSISGFSTGQWNTGIDIDTTEIGNAQRLYAFGFDTEVDFGLSSEDVIYGLEVTSEGADLYGQFLSAESTDQFRDVPQELVPEPAAIGLIGLAGLLTLIANRVRKTVV
jgi:hypothetical protein